MPKPRKRCLPAVLMLESGLIKGPGDSANCPGVWPHLDKRSDMSDGSPCRIPASSREGR